MVHRAGEVALQYPRMETVAQRHPRPHEPAAALGAIKGDDRQAQWRDERQCPPVASTASRRWAQEFLGTKRAVRVSAKAWSQNSRPPEHTHGIFELRRRGAAFAGRDHSCARQVRAISLMVPPAVFRKSAK